MVNGTLEDWLHPQPPSSVEGTNYAPKNLNLLQRSSSVEGTSYAPKNLNLLQRFNIAVDVALALKCLHNSFGASIFYCDLKPSNVLLDDEMVAHIGDLGLAVLSGGSSSSHANQSSSIGLRRTIGYAPPEDALGNPVSKYGDVYSFGILVLEIFTGKRPTGGMFKEGLSLHKFVKAAVPDRVIDILDNALLKDIFGDETITMDTQRQTRNSKILLEGLNSFLGIALSCSVEQPQERLDMKYAAAELLSIRNKLVGARLRQQRRSPPGGQHEV